MTILSTLFRRAERKRVLSDLMTFDDRLLRDIGLTRGDIALMRANRQPTPGRGHE
ncbi:MAG: DUF1127 domain-containing protein [Devosia sp.]